MKRVICIGRQYGSGGREVGELLAQKLGIPCYDKLLLKQAAEEAGLDVSVVKEDEERPVKVGQFLTGNVFADSARMAGTFYFQSQIIYEAERKVIERAAESGPCVIVGRCASSILRGKDILSVFVYGDKDERIKRIMKRNGLEEKEAFLRMKRMDRMRRQYFDSYSDTRWGMPGSYDLMISSSYYGVDGCIRMIMEGIDKTEKEKNHE